MVAEQNANVPITLMTLKTVIDNEIYTAYSERQFECWLAV